ncbi:MAG TPA: hypothetical protein VFW87_08085 [Pirellulales bacterium]|nr:hypothetical protein [Pirellulales bacterium]
MAKTKSKAKPAKTAAKKRPAAKNKPAAVRNSAKSGNRPSPRSSWLDADSHQPVIDRYARRLGPFVEAMADGKIDEAEVSAQEKRLVKLMKEIEPALPPALHPKVTQLLCELTAYDLMRILHSMEQARPKTVFQG